MDQYLPVHAQQKNVHRKILLSNLDQTWNLHTYRDARFAIFLGVNYVNDKTKRRIPAHLHDLSSPVPVCCAPVTSSHAASIINSQQSQLCLYRAIKDPSTVSHRRPSFTRSTTQLITLLFNRCYDKEIAIFRTTRTVWLHVLHGKRANSLSDWLRTRWLAQ